MKTPTKPKKELYIYPKITKDEFIQRVKKEPFSIYSNIRVKRAVYVLDYCCLSVNSDRSNLAKDILIQAGLKAFIPKIARGRKSSNPTLRKLSSRKRYFEILKYKEEISIFLAGRYPRDLQYKKEEDIKKAFKHIFNKDPSIDELQFLRKGDNNKNKAAIAIGFFCIAYDIKDHYEAVKGDYYNISGKDVRENLKAKLPRLFINLKNLKYFMKYRNNLKFLYYN